MKNRIRVSRISRTVQLTMVVLLALVTLAGFSSQTYAKNPFTLIYFDGHMHTRRSDGTGSVADIKDMALRRGLSAVIVTDHCKDLTRAEWASLVAETNAASDSSFLALPGFEMTGSEGIFNRDHILAWNVADPFVGDDANELCPEEVWPSPPNPAGTGVVYPQNLARWVDYVHSHQGIAVHNHPTGTTSLVYGVNDLEVYNQGHVDDIAGYASALGYPPDLAWQFAITLNNFATYGERDANMPVPFPGFPTPLPLRIGIYYATLQLTGVGQWLGAPEAPLNSWDQLLMAYVQGEVDKPIFALANSDAHNTGDLSCGDADGCSTVGVAKNGLYVKELTAKSFFQAIKAGRSFATTGPSLAFDVNGEQMGDTAYVYDGAVRINFSVKSESATAVLVKIDIYKNGQVWKTINPFAPVYVTSLSDQVSAAGYYRVEVTALDLLSGNYYFAWSNPVFVAVQ